MPKVAPTMLALDLATKLGWVHTDGSGGMTALRSKDQGERLWELYDWLGEQYKRRRFAVIVYESGSHKRGGPAMRLGIGFQCVLQMFVAAQRKQGLHIQLIPLNTTKIKKHATGKGSAKKAQMIAAAKKKWQLIRFDDNYIDAKWVLDYAQTLAKNGALR